MLNRLAPYRRQIIAALIATALIVSLAFFTSRGNHRTGSFQCHVTNTTAC